MEKFAGIIKPELFQNLSKSAAQHFAAASDGQKVAVATAVVASASLILLGSTTGFKAVPGFNKRQQQKSKQITSSSSTSLTPSSPTPTPADSVSSLQARISELESAVQLAQAEAQYQFDESSRALETLRREHSDATSVAAAAHNEVEKLRYEAEEARQHAIGAEGRLQDAIHVIDSLRQELEGVREAAHQSAARDVDRLRQEIDYSEQQRNIAEAALADAERTISALQGQLEQQSAGQSTLDSAQVEIQEARDAAEEANHLRLLSEHAKSEAEKALSSALHELDAIRQERQMFIQNLAAAQDAEMQALQTAEFAARRAAKAEADLAEVQLKSASVAEGQISRGDFENAVHALEGQISALSHELQNEKRKAEERGYALQEKDAAIARFLGGELPQGRSTDEILSSRHKEYVQIEVRLSETVSTLKRVSAELDEERKESARLSQEYQKIVRDVTIANEAKETALDRAAAAEITLKEQGEKLAAAEAEIQRLLELVASGEKARQTITEEITSLQREFASMRQSPVKALSPAVSTSSPAPSVLSATAPRSVDAPAPLSTTSTTSSGSTASRRFGDTGLRFAIQNSVVIVSHIMPGSPADLSGLVRVGDAVLSIDSRPITGSDLRMAQGEMYGEQGSYVSIVLRHENDRPTTVDILRGTMARTSSLSSPGSVRTASSSRTSPNSTSNNNLSLGNLVGTLFGDSSNSNGNQAEDRPDLFLM